MAALTKVRHFRDFDSSFHTFSGDPFVNTMEGDKFVDDYMYPGLCVKHCNDKGGSAYLTTKDRQLTAFLGYILAGLEAGE